MAASKEIMNKNILLLNSFVDESIKCEEKDSDQVNGNLFCDTPIGILSIHTHVKKALPNLKPHIIDAQQLLYLNAWNGMDFCWDLLLKKIKEINPRVIGLGQCYYHGSRLFHKTAKKIKELLPQSIIVAGGNYPTDATDIVLADSNIDYVIKSEGEVTFAEFLKKYYASEDLKNIDGICYDDHKKIVINHKKNFIKDISILPIPDRTVLNMDVYGKGRDATDRVYPGAHYLTMVTSRGCPFKCTFCSNKNFWGQRIHYRSVEQVVDEMEILKYKYNADIIGFHDDNFFVNKKRCVKIFDEINRRKLKVKWLAQGGTLVRSLADEEFMEKALESGLCFLNLAIESGSQKTLDLIKKPLYLAEARQLVTNVKKKYPELYMNSGFIIGFPFETKKDIIHTFEYSKKLELDWAVYNNFRPFPGTELYDTCVEQGIIEEFKFENFNETTLAYNGDGEGQSHFDGKDWTKKWLMDTMYTYNLEVNFVNSYNLRTGNYKQAFNDFEYVARSFENHAMAHRQASIAATQLKLLDKAKQHASEEKKIMSNGSMFHKYYKDFSIKPILYNEIEKYKEINPEKRVNF